MERSCLCGLAGAAMLVVLFLAAAEPARAASTKCLPGSLKAALAHIDKYYGRVTVISTYRRNARILGTRQRSKHADCKAVDFRVHGNRRAAIRWLRKQKLEVITYGCGMHHIHVAVGGYKGHRCVDGWGRRKR